MGVGVEDDNDAVGFARRAEVRGEVLRECEDAVVVGVLDLSTNEVEPPGLIATALLSCAMA